MDMKLMTTRILAVVALAGAFVAVVVVISSQTGSDAPVKAPAASKNDAAGNAGDGNRDKQGKSTTARTYEVQEGDSLSAIAVETGVPVETIEELNPDVDPQAIIPGQKLKLR
jgi:LysM repeat protein